LMLEGYGFGRALRLRMPGLRLGFVSGHDFSRAVTA
jgi:hypothetical protein